MSIAIRRRDKDNKKESQMERFAFTCLSNADDTLANRIVTGARLQSSLSWFAAMRGFVCGRVLCINNDGDLVFEILPYDPKFLSYGTDSKGIIWSAYTTWRDPSTVSMEYKDYVPKPQKKNVKDTDTGIEVVEFWDDENYTVLADEQEVLVEKHKLGRPPVIVVPCGSTPLVVGNEGKYGYVRNWGDSIYSGSRSLFEVQNKALSIWYSLLEKAHRPGVYIFDDALVGKTVATPWGRGEAIALSSNARVQPVEPPEIASSMPQFFDIISGAIQRATFPYLRYGQVRKGLDPSGAAINQLLQGPEAVLNPLLEAMSRFYKSAIRMLIDQYKRTGGEWYGHGYDSKGREFQEYFTPADMEGNYDIDVEFVSILPEQEANNYAKAQMIKQSGLADDKFIREKIVQFQDPAGIENDLLIQQAEMISPKVKVGRIVEALRANGRDSEATVLAMDTGLMQPGEAQPQPAPATAQPETEEDIAAKLQAAVGGG